MTEILLKVVLSSINLPNYVMFLTNFFVSWWFSLDALVSSTKKKKTLPECNWCIVQNGAHINLFVDIRLSAQNTPNSSNKCYVRVEIFHQIFFYVCQCTCYEGVEIFHQIFFFMFANVHVMQESRYFTREFFVYVFKCTYYERVKIFHQRIFLYQYVFKCTYYERVEIFHHRIFCVCFQMYTQVLFLF